MSSSTASTDWPAETVDHYEKMGRLHQLSRLLGIRKMERDDQEQHLNREAESKAARRQWIGDAADDDKDADDMGNQTILGDVTNPTPIVVAGNQGGSDTLKTLAAMALGVLVGGGGLAAGAAAAYLLNRPDTETPVVAPTEEPNIGLGRIEDYLPAAAKGLK